MKQQLNKLEVGNDLVVSQARVELRCAVQNGLLARPEQAAMPETAEEKEAREKEGHYLHYIFLEILDLEGHMSDALPVVRAEVPLTQTHP